MFKPMALIFLANQISKSSLAHRGIDISIVYDTIRSASDGLVYFVGYNPSDPVEDMNLAAQVITSL